jgi:hypothetical protein
MTARHASALRIVAGEMFAQRGKARAIVVDVTDADAVHHASELVRKGMALRVTSCRAKHGLLASRGRLPRSYALLRSRWMRSVRAVWTRRCCAKEMPARPPMSPDEIAKTAWFLAHAAPQALTGACIDVYG